MSHGQCPDQQPGNDLVADAQKKRRVVDVMGKRDRCALCDHVSREQGQLHAGGALRHPVTHRRRGTGDLGVRLCPAGLIADDLRVVLIGAVRRKHVVV